jgi:CRP/FNR family transcriptional regulator, cyclic AMP receptor protein
MTFADTRPGPASADGGLPLLSLLGPEAARDVRRAARRRRYRRREVLFREGDIGDTVHFIERGHVTIRGETSLGDTLMLAVLGPGDYFGDIAVLSPDSRRSAGAEALEECTTLALGADDFLALRDRHPAIRRAIAESLARTSRRLVERLLDARHTDARGRLGRQLGHLHSVFDGPVPFTQEDLAAYVGVTRVTVNQILRALAAEGLVEVRRGSVVVLDAGRLGGAT